MNSISSLSNPLSQALANTVATPKDSLNQDLTKQESEQSALLNTHSRLKTTHLRGVVEQANGQRLLVSAEQSTVQLNSSSSSRLQSQNVYSLESVNSSSQNPAANTILSFIDGQLAKDIASGDDIEALQGRLESGLEGFLEGYGQAREQLEGLGQLNGQVKYETEQTYNAVLQGVAQLAAKYGLDNPAQSLLDEQQTQTVSLDSIESALGSTGVTQSDSTLIAQQKGFEFELTTAEGDTVTINAQSAFVASQASSQNQNGSFYAAASESQSSFSFEVNGDLNKDELSAINQLLSDVGDLSRTFYSGNIEQAFNQALELGIDSDQIVGFSLNLNFTSYTQVESNFVDVNRPSGDTLNNAKTSPISNQVARMAEFIQQLEDVRLNGKAINIFENTLEKLFESTLGEQDANTVGQLLQSLKQYSA